MCPESLPAACWGLLAFLPRVTSQHERDAFLCLDVARPDGCVTTWCWGFCGKVEVGSVGEIPQKLRAWGLQPHGHPDVLSAVPRLSVFLGGRS